MIEKLQIEKLEKRLKQPLPSKNAHNEIAPYRNSNQYSEKDINTARKSGVLVLLYVENSKTSIPLIKRVEYPGVHSGQISFPGGRMEDEDETIVSTALREAEEEINIDKSSVNVIGRLSEVFIPPSKSLVTPVIAYTTNKQSFAPEVREVDRILDLHVDSLLDEQALTKSDVNLGNGLKINVPSFRLENEIIWGATAMMLNELRYILREIL